MSVTLNQSLSGADPSRSAVLIVPVDELPIDSDADVLVSFAAVSPVDGPETSVSLTR